MSASEAEDLGSTPNGGTRFRASHLYYDACRVSAPFVRTTLTFAAQTKTPSPFEGEQIVNVLRGVDHSVGNRHSRLVLLALSQTVEDELACGNLLRDRSAVLARSDEDRAVTEGRELRLRRGLHDREEREPAFLRLPEQGIEKQLLPVRADRGHARNFSGKRNGDKERLCPPATVLHPKGKLVQRTISYMTTRKR